MNTRVKVFEVKKNYFSNVNILTMKLNYAQENDAKFKVFEVIYLTGKTLVLV